MWVIVSFVCALIRLRLSIRLCVCVCSLVLHACVVLFVCDLLVCAYVRFFVLICSVVAC